MTRTADIVTFSDLRQHMRKRIDRLKKTGRPLYVTTNGQPDAVVLSPAAFDALQDKAELADGRATIDRSMEDYKAGRVRPFKKAMRDIAKELGLKLDR